MKKTIALFSLLFVTAVMVSAQTQLIGTSSQGPTLDNNSAGQAEAFQATASATGTLTTMSVLLNASNTATTVFVGLYSNSNGHPKTLLGSGTISSPQGGQWNTVTISPSVAVTSGIKYHIALLGTGGTIQFYDTDGGTHSEGSSQTNLTSLPPTWSSGPGWRSGPVSAYGNATTGGGGTVQISISPTSVTVNEGGVQQFTATVTGTSNTNVKWSVTSGTGTVSPSGLFTAPNGHE